MSRTAEFLSGSMSGQLQPTRSQQQQDDDDDQGDEESARERLETAMHAYELARH